MVDIKLKAYHALPCEAETFFINDQKADIYDFGEYEYDDEEECDDEDILRWGCYGKYFKTKPYDENLATVLKYCLSKEDYDEVCSELEGEFAIGTCGWCV